MDTSWANNGSRREKERLGRNDLDLPSRPVRLKKNLQRYASGTPDYAKGMRRQELGFYTNVGVRGTF